jgi:hypothetical protein
MKVNIASTTPALAMAAVLAVSALGRGVEGHSPRRYGRETGLWTGGK